MTDEDGFRIEAAEQFGFKPTDDDCEHYACTHAQIIAFAKACERKGRAEAAQKIADTLAKMNATSDAELAPILEAERLRFLAAHEAPIPNPDF